MNPKTDKPTMRGEGPKDAAVMLVGQNPGREEIKQRRPFVGRAGQYVNKVLQKYGLDRDNLYLTGVVKEGTPRNRKPAAEEINRDALSAARNQDHPAPHCCLDGPGGMEDPQV
jgi:uracil-DNA glycosylase family 4